MQGRGTFEQIIPRVERVQGRQQAQRPGQRGELVVGNVQMFEHGKMTDA